MAATETHTNPSATRRKMPVIDCDIHNAVPSHKVLHPYMSERWRRHLEMVGTPARNGSYIPRGVPYAARKDAWAPFRQSARFGPEVHARSAA